MCYQRIIGLVITVFVLAVPARAGEEMRFYAVMMDGKKVGYALMSRTELPGRICSTQRVKVTIARMNVPLNVIMTETHIETPKGKPLGFESIQDMSGFVMKVTGEVKPNGKVDLAISSMGQVNKQQMDWPEGAVMSEGLNLLQKKKGLGEGSSYEVTVFSAVMLTTMPTKITIGGVEKVDLLGRVVRAHRIISEITSQAGDITEISYVDDNYKLLKSITPMMGINLELISCSKEVALSDDDVVDFFDKLVLAAPKPLADLERAQGAVYLIKPTGGREISIPNTDSQTVRKIGNSLEVTVEPIKKVGKTSFPCKGHDKRALEALKPTIFLQSDNQEIVDLARKAVGDVKDAYTAAKRIEKFVSEYIEEKNLSVGYASAAEVAQSRQGDCSEHAVLVAAMCRAVGIPAEVVVGLVNYNDGASGKELFGPHAWAQAYIGNKWVGLDATGSPRGFSAGHITLSVGSGNLDSFFDVISTMGYFKISDVKLMEVSKNKMQVTSIHNPICHLGECPVWNVTEEVLYWTDIREKRLWKYDPQSKVCSIAWQGEVMVGGFAFTPKNDIVLCSDKGVFLLARSGEDKGKMTLLFDLPHEGEGRFNDITTDPRGRIFAGTLSSKDQKGVLYRLEKGREPVVVLEGLGTSNGMTFSMDLKYFYHCDSRPATITRYDYDAETGNITNPKIIYQGKREQGGAPDGITLDTQDHIWAACWGGWRVIRINPETGKIVREIPTPARQTSSVMFGGKDLNVLFMTSACQGGADLQKGLDKDGNYLGGETYYIPLEVRGRAEWPANF